MTLVTVREEHLPEGTLEEKYETAQAWGFDGISLRRTGERDLVSRMTELRRAKANGVVMPTAGDEVKHGVHVPGPANRSDTLRRLTSQLTVIAEIGGIGLVTSESLGLFSKQVDRAKPPRSRERQRTVLLEALQKLGAHAESMGVELLLEPQNRYEEGVVTSLADAAYLIDEAGSPAIRIAAGTLHMNLEEADPAAALLGVAAHVGHVRASDSNGREPGAGHLDWALLGSTLRAIGYDRSVAVGALLSGPAATVLPPAAGLLRRYL